MLLKTVQQLPQQDLAFCVSLQRLMVMSFTVVCPHESVTGCLWVSLLQKGDCAICYLIPVPGWACFLFVSGVRSSLTLDGIYLCISTKAGHQHPQHLYTFHVRLLAFPLQCFSTIVHQPCCNRASFQPTIRLSQKSLVSAKTTLCLSVNQRHICK
jgi:hypothetical protein